MDRNLRALAALGIVLGLSSWLSPPLPAQLFQNLEAFASRLEVRAPLLPGARLNQGPKGIAWGDLNGDGAPDLAVSSLDGTVTVYRNGAAGKFEPPVHLRSGASSLRGIVAADLDGDSDLDIAAAAPFEGRIKIFWNLGAGSFSAPSDVPAWLGARNLAAGDFDGDGALELAVGGPVVGLRHYRRGLDGSFEVVATILELVPEEDDFPKPVYSLHPLRIPEAGRDVLIATHAFSTSLWILAAGASGGLEVSARLSDIAGVYSLDAAPVLTQGGLADLVTAHRDLGTVEVRRGIPGNARFELAPSQVIHVPGGPRTVRIVDLDGDGWKDLVVVVRNLDRVLTYRNNGGSLVPSTEMPVGRSPRDLAAADFSSDGRPDVAVINRVSSDISILNGYAGQAGFGALDQFYLVDGEVGGLTVFDFNEDGRDDVAQLHRASGDLSVRLAAPDGSLGTPVFYPVGSLPAAHSSVDVNNDGRPDFVTVNLGLQSGSISVRLGEAEGRLGPERRYELSFDMGRPFAIEMADFDSPPDGNVDLAAGFIDCRLGFWKGAGDGSFTFTREHTFIYEARVMASGDFDHDGDIDLAGGSYTGDLVVVNNHGGLLTSPSLDRAIYNSPTPEKFGTQSIEAVDVNRDDFLDLVLGSGEGMLLYMNQGNGAFRLASTTVTNVDFPASSVAAGDFDADGDSDIALSCQILSCVTILTRDAAGTYAPALTIDVPAGRLIASGDLDGDGKDDLVGSGEVLWTALSSRKPQGSKPPVLEASRSRIEGPVLNEVLAGNTEFPVASDGGRTSDWVELYNGAAGAVSLTGWQLVLEEGGEQHSFPFPAMPASTIEPGRHLVVTCTKEPSLSPLHAKFNLPREGGVLRLLKSTGEKVDEIRYPSLPANVSYGRYKDGLPALAATPYPSPARENTDNGTVEPRIRLRSTVPAVPAPDMPIRFFATGTDDVGIVTMSILYRIAGRPFDGFERVLLYDDGTHEDEASQDGNFSGVLEPGLPRGTNILFYLEAVDLSDNLVTAPEDANPSDDEALGELYSLAVGVELPHLELSELVAANESVLQDERGNFDDYVEVENCGPDPVSLDGVFLAEHFPATEDWFAFPAGITIAPGEHLIVFCDDELNDGPLHAPFHLDKAGGRVALIGTAPGNIHALIDSVDYGKQSDNQALARAACGGAWAPAVPTPEDVVATLRGDADGSRSLTISDAIVILGYLFLGENMRCIGAADADASGLVNLTDPIYVLRFLFQGGPAPPGDMVSCHASPAR